MPTFMTNEDYVKRMGDDFMICPNCKSHNTNEYPSCDDCGASWQEFFVVGGYTNLYDKEHNRLAHFDEDEESSQT